MIYKWNRAAKEKMKTNMHFYISTSLQITGTNHYCASIKTKVWIYSNQSANLIQFCYFFQLSLKSKERESHHKKMIFKHFSLSLKKKNYEQSITHLASISVKFQSLCEGNMFHISNIIIFKTCTWCFLF